MKKRILAAFLVVIMVVSLMPTAMFAANASIRPDVTKLTTKSNTAAKVETQCEHTDCIYEAIDDNYHKIICKSCGKIIEDKAEHGNANYDYCNNYDGTHDVICKKCNYKYGTYEHYIYEGMCICEYCPHEGKITNCICDTCGKPAHEFDEIGNCKKCSHECDYKNLVYIDNKDGTHKGICKDCGYVTKSSIHVVKYNGKPVTCACGYTCDHMNNDYEYTPNDDGETHTVICKDCGGIADIAKHVFEDDTPCICGATKPVITCHHANNNYEYTPNDDGETHTVICKDCGGIADIAKHVINDNGKPVTCVCGYACDHVGVQECININNPNGHKVVCPKCGTTTEELAAHVFENGNPCACGATAPVVTCEHMNNYSYTPNADGKTHTVTCNDCGIVLHTANHVVKDNGKPVTCVCGYACDHVGVQDCININNPNGHKVVCKKCGTTTEELAAHVFEDGNPCACGATAPVVTCEHMNNYSYTPNADGKTHTVTCNDCGIVLHTANHVVKDNGKPVTCVCGYACDHVGVQDCININNPNGHKVVCPKCGTTTEELAAHVFEDGNPCACGAEEPVTPPTPIHEHKTTKGWSKDDLSHWHVCDECGEKFDIAKHTSDWKAINSTFKYKVCDVCDHLMAVENITSPFDMAYWMAAIAARKSYGINSTTNNTEFGTITNTISSTPSDNKRTVVKEGNSITYTITPAEGYAIKSVKVDGRPVILSSIIDEDSNAAKYTFNDVSASHKIEVKFAPETTAATAPVTAAKTAAPIVK